MQPLSLYARISLLAASSLVVVLLVPASALAAEYTVSLTAGSYLQAVADDFSGANQLDQLNPATLPFAGSSSVTDGAAQSQGVYSLTNDRFQVDIVNARPNAAGYGLSGGSVNFSSDVDIHYTLEGTYTAVDSEGRAVLYSVLIIDQSTATNVFESTQNSVATANESFILGLSEGDASNTSAGSLTGTLLAGRTYSLSYNIYMFASPTASTVGATGTGYFALSFAPIIPTDPDRFLADFNSVASEHKETAATSAAYHAAIDPFDQRLTLSAWRTKNGFDSGADAEAIYVNDADLGFGRHMFIKTNPGNKVASYVQNYTDNTPGPGGDPVDGPAEEKIDNAHNATNLLATVAMEYGPPDGDPDHAAFTRFYAFDAAGNRLLGADLDGRGEKFIPGVCTVCHGGNPPPLTDNGSYPDHGDVGASFLPWDLDTLVFSDTLFGGSALYSQGAQEDDLKLMNTAALLTNPTPAAREVIEGWYGGPVLPNDFDGDFVPNGWTGQEDAYLKVYAPNCRACHVMRNQATSFQTYAEFQQLVTTGRVQEMVFDRGVMPLARRTYDRFWSDFFVSAPGVVDLFGAIPTDRWPGNSAPHAFAGPDERVDAGVVKSLNANDSNYALSFAWILQSAPVGSASTLSDPLTAEPSFTPDVEGDYLFQLTASNALGSSVAYVVISATSDGSNPGVDFETEILPIFQSKCVSCHNNTPGYPDFTGVGSVFGETPYLESVYQSFSSRVTVLDPARSLLLQKPTLGVTHVGGQPITPGSADEQTFFDWISQGASRATIPGRWTPTYQKTNASLVNPIQTTSGEDHAYAGLDLEPFALVPNAELSFAVLAESDLHNADFSYANLFGADLSLSELSDVIFANADLGSGTFSGASFSDADLSDAILDGANFDLALFEYADLDSGEVAGASFLGADFSNATNLGSTTGNALYDDDTNFSGTGFDPVAKGWTYVPEPDGALMLAVGCLALAGLDSRRRSKRPVSRKP